MTKREHDKATKEGWGRMAMASDERWNYRARRAYVMGDDYLARRAAEMTRRNTAERIAQDGRLATLGAGCRFRAIAAYRREQGLPMF